MTLFWFVLAPILAGLCAMAIKDKWMAAFLIVFQTFLVTFAFRTFMQVRNIGPIVWNSAGYEDGLALSLYADTLSVFLIFITSIFFLFFIVYAINQDYFQSQFNFLFLVLQGLMMGLFLSSDLFNIFVFLEVATVVVAILIMFNKEKQAIYDGMIYFFVNVIGTTFLLLGVGMLYQTFGLLDMRYLQEAMTLLEDPRAMILPFSLMMVTVSLKTAIVPLFSWLPKAHGTPSAPPVVSAVLSGVYIKTGVYLYIRFTQMYSPVIDLSQFFFIVGFITGVVGAIMALGQNDIKLILAYSTVSQIGLIMMGVNIGTEIAFWGSVYHILNHAIFKSSLFLTSGIVYHSYGTRDVFEIRGILKQMPAVGIAMGFSILGIMGAPLFNASISKYMITHAATNYWSSLMLNLVNLGTVMIFVKFAAMLFGNSRLEAETKPKTPAKLSSLVLGFGSLVTGVFAVPLTEFLLNYNLSINTAEYTQKNIIFVLMVIAGIGFYQGVIKQGGTLNRIGHIELTFNAIITSMAGYFIVIAVLLGVVL